MILALLSFLVCWIFGKSVHIVDDRKLNIDSIPHFRVIYFSLIVSKRWQTVTLSQMKDIKQFGLMKRVTHMSIVLSTSVVHQHNIKDDNTPHLSTMRSNRNQSNDLLQNVESFIRQELGNDCNITFSFHNENQFEYPGIKLLHDEATKYPNALFLYFHGKGTTNHQNEKRVNEELALNDIVLKPWGNIINLFDEQKTINKAGFGCAEEGFVWYNYIWIRGDFLSKLCKPPIITGNRYYYERYLGIECNRTLQNDCFSLVKNSSNPISEANVITAMNFEVCKVDPGASVRELGIPFHKPCKDGYL
eukprot:gene13017-17449_t